MRNLHSYAMDISLGKKTLHVKNVAPAVYCAMAVCDVVSAPFRHLKRMVCEKGYAKDVTLFPTVAFAAFGLLAAASGTAVVSAPVAVGIAALVGLGAGQLMGITANMGFPNERTARANRFMDRMAARSKNSGPVFA